MHKADRLQPIPFHGFVWSPSVSHRQLAFPEHGQRAGDEDTIWAKATLGRVKVQPPRQSGQHQRRWDGA